MDKIHFFDKRTIDFCNKTEIAPSTDGEKRKTFKLSEY